MKPVILAGGRGERFKGDTIKPLAEIGGTPLIHHALIVARIVLPQSEVTVVVNPDNRDRIAASINDDTVNMVVQEEITGPATGVRDVYEADRSRDTDELLVIQADDAVWFHAIAKHFEEVHTRKEVVASMALLKQGDPNVHHTATEVDGDEIITGTHVVDWRAPDPLSDRQGFNAGIYVVGRGAFLGEYWEQSRTNDNLGLPSILYAVAERERVAGPIYDVPWSSTDTVEGLLQAQELYEQNN